MLLKRILIVLAIVMLAVPAMAQEKVPSRLAPGSVNLRVPAFAGPAFNARANFEGFEDAVPPAGWQLIVTNPDATWAREGNGWGLEGGFAALCDWNAEVAQDEQLTFEHTVDIAGGEYVLSFWQAGSTGQPWDLNARETVEINGVEVWSFDDEVNFGHHFEYEQFFIDLSPWDGQTITISFRYVGVNGDGHFMDAVMIDDGEGWAPPPPPPAPLNDTCEGAWDNDYFIPSGDFAVRGDNTTALHDYALVADSCISYGFSGLDLVWAVCMEEGDNLAVEMIGQDVGFDAVFFLISDCSDPTGSCVAGGDEPEVIDYTATVAGTYYLVCGGWANQMVHEFELVGTFTGAGCGPVATEGSSWGNLKAIYR